MSRLIELWTQLHFLRPYWLLALLLVPILALIHLWRKRQEHWQQAIDPHLLIHLLEGGKPYKRAAQIIKLCVLVLAILALAGPSWQKIEHTLLEPKADPLVIVLDLSSAIMTPDLPPSRLVQARAKLKRLLEQRQSGEVALVVYANDAFTVTPLTDDGANVILFLDALAPEIMPQDGQRPDRALKWAKDLLQQSGTGQGDILLLTNQADTSARRQAADIHKAGYRLSVLALGSAQGGTYRTRNGRVVHSKRDSDALNTLASAGGGHYQVLTANDDDLHALGVLEPQAHLAVSTEATSHSAQLWQDQGYWLLLPLLLLVLPAFRQLSHRTSILLIYLGFLPWAAELHAEESSSLWQRPDQIQHRQLAEGVQAYREGAYARAQQLFSGNENAEAWYNQGNALARQGHYEQAIAAYDRALEQQPDMEDAIANRAIVEAARQQQEQQSTQAQDEDEANSSSQKSENAEESEPDTQSEQENSSANSENQSQEDSNEGELSDQHNSDASSPDDQPSNGEETESTQSAENSSSPDGKQDQNQNGNDNESKDSPSSDSGSPSSPDSSEDQNLDAEDSVNQQQADAALQEQMNQALQQAQPADSNSNPTSSAQTSPTPLNPQQQHELEQQQALEAWLQRIPDDPGALLRAKFQIEHQRRRREGR